MYKLVIVFYNSLALSSLSLWEGSCKTVSEIWYLLWFVVFCFFIFSLSVRVRIIFVCCCCWPHSRVININLFSQMNEDRIQTMITQNEIIVNLSLSLPLPFLKFQKKSKFLIMIFLYIFNILLGHGCILGEGMSYMCWNIV